MRDRFALLAVVWLTACGSDAVGPVADSGGFVAVTVGADHSCGLALDGMVFCWGSGRSGLLGTGDTLSRSVPVRIGRDLHLTALSAGSRHTCGLDVGGSAFCWGGNTHGQLGNASVITQGLPVEVATTLRFATIASGWLHTCAATSAGVVHCWGSNAQGQMGPVANELELSPRVLATDLRFGVLTAGGSHTCGLVANGTAYCWGGNSLGQLGDGTTVNRTSPTAVAGGHRFRDIAAGYTHTCGVREDGAMLCWGSSVYGELGTAGAALPGYPGAVEPQAVAGTRSFARVAAGYYVSCGVATDSRVWCWGRGGEGQLGNGTAWDAYSPQPVSDGNPNSPLLRRISVGVTHVCGVSAQNTAACWGRGNSGQLGAGGTAYSPLAIRVRME